MVSTRKPASTPASTPVSNLGEGVKRVQVGSEGIDEIRKEEEALRKKVRDLSRAQRLAHIGHWEWNLQTGKVDWSDEAFRIFGMEPCEVSFELVKSLTHPDDVDFWERSVNEAVFDNKSFSIDYRAVRPDGSVCWIHNEAEVVRDGEGNPLIMFGTAQDITDKKQTEEALRESEERHRILFKTMLHGVLYRDSSGNIIGTNPAAEEILGLDVDTIRSRTMIDPQGQAIREDGSAFQKEALPSWVAFQTGRPVENVMMGVYNPKDGKHRWIVVNSIPQFRSGEGKPFQVHTTFTDVTGLKEAEEALRKSEERYRHLFESIADAVMIFDAETLCFEDANEAALGLFGFTKEECLTLTPVDISAEPQKTRARLKKTRRERAEKRHVPLRYFKRKDGTVFPGMVSSGNMKIGGRLKMISIIRDITERLEAQEALRQSEQIYRIVVDNSLTGIFVVTGDRFLFVNEQFSKITGYSWDELQSMNPFEMIAPEKRGEVMAISKKRLAEMAAPSEYETWILDKKGDLRTVSVSATRIDFQGKSAVLGVYIDITDKKLLEEKLVQAQKMKAIGTLVSGVAHEINNPTNLIMFNVPILKRLWNDLLPVIEKEALAEPYKKYGGLTYEYIKNDLNQLLEDTELAATRIARIVKGLRNFSRKSDFGNMGPVDLNRAVENVLRLAQSTLNKSDVELVLDLGTQLPFIEGNAQFVEQIVLNLLTNAVQAIDKDMGRIEINTRYNQETNSVSFQIRDNGRGIGPSVRNKIFDPFFTDRQAEGGTGLGLSVTYNLVKAQNGVIDFTSKKGKGSIFSVEFSCGALQEKAKILIADDDAAVRKGINWALRGNPRYRIIEATSGTEALIKLGTEVPNLVILDLLMPEMNGEEVCRTIREEKKLRDVHVILMTGFPDHPTLQRVMQLGIKDVFLKPFNHEDMVRRIGEILEGEVKIEY